MTCPLHVHLVSVVVVLPPILGGTQGVGNELQSGGLALAPGLHGTVAGALLATDHAPRQEETSAYKEGRSGSF